MEILSGTASMMRTSVSAARTVANPTGFRPESRAASGHRYRACESNRGGAGIVI